MKWVTPLAERIEATAPIIDARSAEDYCQRAIRKILLDAANDGRLAVGPAVISKHARPTKSKIERGAFDLAIGRKNLKRVEDLIDIRTTDGGWLSIAAVLRPSNGSLEVVAYNAERVFPTGHHPPWIRFDFNESGHPNDQRGL